jgi:hypothetical protein
MHKMRTTTDTYTGKRFLYNMTARCADGRVTVARCTDHEYTWLHPDRLLPTMLRRLNPSGSEGAHS